MTIKITIINNLTNEVVVDNTITVNSNDHSILKANHQCMAEAFPDCGVTFEQMDGNSFIYGMPVNQKNDEALVESDQMTWDDYVAKWYSE